MDTIEFDVSYTFPILWEDSIFDSSNPTLDRWVLTQKFPKLCVWIEADILTHFPVLLSQLRSKLEAWGFSSASIQTYLGGEAHKTVNVALEMCQELATQKLCRHSAVIAIGGGAFLDTVGMACALVHRGVRLIRVPTTSLAMCDSAVGVKNAVNAYQQKNFLGTFNPPFAVIGDTSFLHTLPYEIWRCAIPEALKVAMICDINFYHYLLSVKDLLCARDEHVMKIIVRKSAELHYRHIATQGDPFEMGSARPLDFGHWLAHRLELVSNYAISHGEAVAIGIALDSLIAAQRGFISPDDARRVIQFLCKVGFNLFPSILVDALKNNSDHLFAGLLEFREHLGGELHITFPNPMGSRLEVDTLSQGEFDLAIHQLSSFL